MTQQSRKGMGILFPVLYGALSIALLLFSYTQVDLNLTLSRASIVQTIEKSFQYIGYYNRPLSTTLYGLLVLTFSAVYIVILRYIERHEVTTRQIWHLIAIVTVILVFSYPAAFSYDFFNYLFTAKTVAVYHQNPYVVTPLQFAGIDPWTNFMRWTHLTSAYPPLWILISLAPFFLGMGYFIPVLFATKFMIAGFYLLSCWALSKIIRIVDKNHESFGLAAFALQPLLLIESLVSGHNDIVLVAFALLSMLSFIKKDVLQSFFLLSLSIAAKLMTIVLIPVYWLKKDRQWMLAAMAVGLILVLLRREFLPWYWVWMLPFVAVNYSVPKLIRFSAILSCGLLLSYAPYLFFGEYSPIEQLWKTGIIWSFVGGSTISLIFPASKRYIL